MVFVIENVLFGAFTVALRAMKVRQEFNKKFKYHRNIVCNWFLVPNTKLLQSYNKKRVKICTLRCISEHNVSV